MNGDNNSEIPEPVTIVENWSRKVFRPLLDNAFDEFDGFRGGKHLDITITLTKHSITIENLGGKGMGAKELSGWLDWGEPHKTDAIGEYGQGGKAAMGYLGSAWIVQAKRWNEPWLWTIREDNWDDVSSSEKKKFKAVASKDKNKKHDNLGYCKFEIRKLIKKRRQDITRMKAELSNTYRKYLEEGKASIALNYKPVIPLELPIYEGFKIEQFKEKTPEGFNIHGWVGRLKRDARVRGGPRITGGMRLLRKGRLIRDGEYFGHPDFRNKASLGTLIGEVDLTKVPVLPIKTGFDTDSPEWETARKVMYRILKPHIDDLLKQKEEEAVSREEKKRVSHVREMMIEAFKILNKYSDFPGKSGGDRGRKPPEVTTAPSLNKESKVIGKRHEPRTSPPEDAIGRLRRLGKMPEWEIKVLQPEIRSEWGRRNERRYLLINKKYCLYEEREGDELYLAETAALQLARPERDEKITQGEYLNEVDLLMRAFCEVLNPAQ